MSSVPSGRKRLRQFDKIAKHKLSGLFILVVTALLCLLIRIGVINASRGEQYTRQVLAANQASYGSAVLASRRGDILDRNGAVLASSEKKYKLVMDCHSLTEAPSYLEGTAAALKEVFGIERSVIDGLLADESTRGSYYQVLDDAVTVEKKQAYDTYVSSHKGLYGGVYFEEYYTRNYPMKHVASSVLGFLDDKDTASWGIEGYYNNYLSGTDGRRFGTWESGSDISQTIVDPKNGASVVSTIDINIQQVVEKHIRAFCEYYKGEGGGLLDAAANIGVVVMDPNDFSVLAMADQGSFDPNEPRDLSAYFSEEEIAGMTNDEKVERLSAIWRNFCISDAYEPGSVYKPVTVAGALQDGSVDGATTVFCDGYETVSGTKIKCSHLSGHGTQTVGEVIVNSCNDGAMQIAAMTGTDEFCRFQSLFNFGRRTGVDLSGEASGIVRTADTMGQVDLACASFGQGFTVTMIQEISAVASIVNGGYYYRPHVVSRVCDDEGTVIQDYDDVLVRRTVSKDVSDEVRKAMKDAVDSGCAVASKVNGYSMGGKTGTAQKIPRGNGKYLVSYIGFVPYEDPKVLIYVVVDEPNAAEQANNKYPQWLARDILEEILPYMGIFPDEERNDSNPYLRFDYDDPNGDQEKAAEGSEPTSDAVSDTNVSEPQGTGTDTGDQGNTMQENGFTDREAGLE